MSQTKRSLVVLPEEVAHLTRRQLVSQGMSLTAQVSLAALLGPKILLGSQAARAQTSFAPQRRLVWVNLGGGWDILEATDPKRQSTSGIDMSYSWGQSHLLAGATDDNCRLGRWWPNTAAEGQDVIIVRGLAMGTTSHDAGPVYMDTGILSNNGEVNAASIPAIVASESTATIPVIQLGGGMIPQTDRGLLKPVSVVRAQNLELYRSLYPSDAAAKERRVALMDYMRQAVTRMRDEVGTNDRLAAVETAEDKIRAQIQSELSSTLTLSDTDLAPFRDPNAGNSRWGGGGDGSSWALALKLLKNDVVTTVTLGVGGFDTHTNQEANLSPIMTRLDMHLATFIRELRTAGQLDSTLIVLYSDFGRTPKVNGGNGRDHWPVGGALLIGGGLEGSRSVGGTDDNLQALDTNLTTGAVQSGGGQLNPTHLGGSVLQLTLGSAYLPYRSYLTSIPALTRLKG